MIDESSNRGGFREGAGRKPNPGRIRYVDLLSFLKSAKPPRQKCGYTVHLWSKDDHHKNLALRALCGSWKCPQCGEYNKRKWISHITYVTRFFDAAGHLSRRASMFETSPEEWKSSVSKWLKRQDADFMHIRLADGRLIVINNGGVGEMYSGDKFRSALEKIFQAVGYDRKPVFTSKRWRLPKPNTKFRWVRLNNLWLTLSELEKALAGLENQPVKIVKKDKDRVIFECPAEWTDEMLEDLANDLANMKGEESES